MLILFLILLLEGLLFFFINQFSNFNDINLETISTFLILINSIVYVFIIGKYSNNKTQYLIFLVAYFIRLFFLYWDIYGRDIFPLPNSGMDSEMYHENAIKFSNGLDEERGGFYSIIIGCIYYLFGEQRIIAQYLNVLFGVFTILLLKKMIEKFTRNKNIILTIILLASFLPNFIVMNAILLRESIIIYFITFSLYFFLNWWKSNKFSYLLLSLFFPIIASLFHSGSFALLLGYVLIVIFYDRSKQKYILNYKTILYGLFFIGIFYLLNYFYSDILFAKFSRIDSISDLSETAEVYTTGGSAYLENVKADNLLMLILLTPLRMFYFIASPLPWDWRGFQDIFAFLFSGIFYLFTLIFAFKALRSKKNNNLRNLIVGLLILAVITMLFFSWGVSNSGTALRHREKFIAIYIILLAVSLISLRIEDNKK